MEMLEFVKANPVLYAKEHVHFVDKTKKDRLGTDRGPGWKVRARCQTLVPDPTHQVQQADFRPQQVRLRQELPAD